ncbi:hypothetical protein [Streptomyces sp. NPDC060194]|uniref:BACON domain-containing protein n=1 Tax=Streptomyces sp. NPDC060194 TaxID=3347069 RepID=UPI003665DAF3
MTSRHQDPPPSDPSPARRGEPRRSPRQSAPARDEPHLDGLFTYCLSVLCDHDSAIATLGEVLALAERQRARCPEDPDRHAAWLYALARWACLRALAAQRGRVPRGRRAEEAEESRLPEDVSAHRQRELALLAWPEAAGTSPEQREALELAVRHRLTPEDVAAVLGVTPQAARETLATAACEVERTRTALAIVETGSCAVVTGLTGDERVLLGAALRLEIVRHVDSCPRCRRAAEGVVGAGAWPGTSVTPARLPVLSAPRGAARAAMRGVPRGRATAPRFNRAGFPMSPRDQAARRDRLRSRAVTTTVVATVVAAPVLALWAAYRGAPPTGEGSDRATVTADEENTSRTLAGDHPAHDSYDNAGNARPDTTDRFTSARRPPDVSVEVLGGDPAKPSVSGGTAHSRFSVDARRYGDTTVVTLRAGSAPLVWSLHSDAFWLRASRSSGTLAPGETFTVHITVDRTHEPGGHWTAHLSVAPGDAVVVVRGYGPGTPTGPPATSGPPPSSAAPSPPPPFPSPSEPEPGTPPPDPGPTPSPTTPDPTPEPTPTTPGPTDPAPTDDPPPPTDTPAPAAN